MVCDSPFCNPSRHAVGVGADIVSQTGNERMHIRCHVLESRFATEIRLRWSGKRNVTRGERDIEPRDTSCIVEG